MAAKKKRSKDLQRKRATRKAVAAGKAEGRAFASKAIKDATFDAIVAERFGVSVNRAKKIITDPGTSEKWIKKAKRDFDSADRRYRRQAKKVIRKKK